MGRDWTPQELRNVDKYMAAQGNSLRNANFVFHNVITGEEIPLTSEEEREIGKKFPELSFLFEGWFELYNEFKNTVVKEKVFVLMEDALQSVIADEEGRETKANVDAEIETVVKDWYEGKLDTNFYYRERNNEAFAEFIRETYTKMIAKL